MNLESAGGHQAAPRRKRQNQERLRTPEWTDNGLVFSKWVGRPMDHTFHSLRHTFGTALVKRGEHSKIVQSLLAHASIVQRMGTTRICWRT